MPDYIELNEDAIEQHLAAAKAQAEEREAQEKAALAAARTFTKLNPSFEKTPGNSQALTRRLQELQLSPIEVQSYETAWCSLCAETIKYGTKVGQEAIDAMPSHFMRERLGVDPVFSRGVDYILRGGK